MVVRVGCARALSLISVLDPGWLRAGDMMVDGVIPLGECVAAARSIRAVHELVVAAGAGVELAAVHLGDEGRDAHRPGHAGRSPRRRVLAAGDSCA